MRRPPPQNTLGRLLHEGLAKKGMTPQQLAQALGVDTSMVSRVMHGRRRFKPANLSLVAQLLELDADVLAELSDQDPADVGAWLEKRKRAEWSLSSGELAEHAWEGVQHAILLREKQSPQQAIAQLSTWIVRLNNRLHGEAYPQRRELMSIQLQAFHERILTHLYFVKPGQAVSNVLPDFHQLQKCAQELTDQRALTRANAWMVDAYYVDKQHQESRWRGEALIAGGIRTEHYRGLIALLPDYGYLHDVDGFLQVERQVLNAMDKGRFDQPLDRAILFERIGRARALLALSEVENRLHQSEVELGASIEFIAPMRQVNLLRTRLIALSTSPRPDRDAAVELAEKGLRLTHHYGFTRHTTQILSLAQRLSIMERLSVPLTSHRLDAR